MFEPITIAHIEEQLENVRTDQNSGITDMSPDIAIALLERLKYLERLALPDERATPEGHLDAWADTNEGYSVRKGWTITCLWCNAEFYGDTKTHALGTYEIHEQQMIQRAEANHLKEVITCSSPT